MSLDKFIGRKIQMFRCHFNPMIGPKPMQAFVPPDLGADAELTSQGVYIKLANGMEHFVPFSNIESIKFIPLSTSVIEEQKRGPGRPPKEHSSGAI